MTELEYYKAVAELQAECLTKDKMICELRYVITDLKYQLAKLERALNE
jgi:hypothetical protein